MNQTLFTALLALAWFGGINAALSALVTVACRWLFASPGQALRGGRPGVWPGTRADLLFALKLLPGSASVLFVVFLFLPAHWVFEPRGVEESAGYTLVSLAGLGAVTMALALRRVAADTLATCRLEWGWRRRAVGPSRIGGVSVPVYSLSDHSPVITLSGLRRPRVFLGHRVVDAFSDDELMVSLAHEQAHHEVRDNLKRILIACSPDLLGLWSAGRALARRWRAAVEFEADARAVDGSEERAVSLASALVKVARLAPAAASVGSRLYDGTLLRARIDRLLSPAAPPASAKACSPAWSLPLAGGALLVALLAAENLWLGVHSFTEGLIRLLP